jgi:hypothetical protein
MLSATPPTAETVRSLLHRNAALATWLAELGATGIAAAAALARVGTPPSDDLVRDLAEAAHRSAALRDEVLAAATAIELATPPADVLASTRQLEAVLTALLEGLASRDRSGAATRARVEALSVLDRVAALAHRDDPAFSALAVCHARADEVRAALAAPAGGDAADALLAVAEAIAPFKALLALRDGARKLDDDKWATLQDAVAAAFGRSLATAASRGRLISR